MNNISSKIKNNVLYILGGILVFFILLTLSALILFKEEDGSVDQKVLPTPTIVPINTKIYPTLSQDPENGTGLEEAKTPTDTEKENRSYLVMSLVEKLPYQGQYFSLSYDFNTGTFLLVYAKNNLSQAQENLNTFLNENGVKDVLWIESLITSYK